MRTLPWYNINHALSVELGLRGAELQIYSALKVLTSKDGSWKGTANELEDSALTGKGEDTITNIVKKLALRGLFKADIKKGLGISIDFPKNSEALPKNSELHPNNSEVHPKNSEVPKESTKENNNKLNISESVSKDTHALAQEVQDFDGSFYTPESKPKSREEYNQYCLKLKCLVRTREYFWSWNDWKKWKRTEGDWRKALQWWMRNDELNLEKEQSRRP